MGTKILKIAAGAVVLATGALTAKYGVSMKVEKKAKAEETATEEKTEEAVEAEKAEKVEKAEKAEKREPRKGGKKWRKAQAEQNK